MQNTLLLKTNSACKTSGGWEGLIKHTGCVFFKMKITIAKYTEIFPILENALKNKKGGIVYDLSSGILVR